MSKNDYNQNSQNSEKQNQQNKSENSSSNSQKNQNNQSKNSSSDCHSGKDSSKENNYYSTIAEKSREGAEISALPGFLHTGTRTLQEADASVSNDCGAGRR